MPQAKMSEKDRKKFRDAVLKARAAQSVTQVDLAMKAGVSLNTVRNLEQGAALCSFKTRDALAKALGLKV